MCNNPKVSVLMPVYNTNGEYLKEAIESILNQTYKDFEFLIADDGSENEETKSVLQSFIGRDERLKIMFEKHSGVGLTRNKLLESAKGEYCAIMDSDDISLPQRLEKEVGFLDKNPEISVLGASIEIFPQKQVLHYIESPKYFNLLQFCCIGNPTAMYRRADFLKYDLKYKSGYNCDDYELWSRAIRYLKFYNIREVLVKYRWHGKNISTPTKEFLAQDLSVKKQMIDFLTDDNKLKEKLKIILNLVPAKKDSFWEQIFSVKNEAMHKVITILRIKIKFRRMQNI